MKTWKRVPTDTLCGFCNGTIARGEPALFTKLPNVKRERVRCENCAGEAPPDLPPLVEPGQRTKKMAPLMSGAQREWLPHPND